MLLEESTFSFVLEFLLLALAFVAFVVWLMSDFYRFTRFEGQLKRGVKVWSRELPSDVWQTLLSMNTNFIESNALSSRPKRFIRVQESEILIFSSPENSHSSWECVGYVDKSSVIPELEYRMSVPGIIFLLPMTLIGVIIFALSFYMYKKAIDSFLDSRAGMI